MCPFSFESVGIYVVMFVEIQKTLLRVLIIFSVLIIAFGLSFYILLSNVSYRVWAVSLTVYNSHKRAPTVQLWIVHVPTS